MKISVLSMFPEILEGFTKNPIVTRAIESNSVSFLCVDIKEHTSGCFRKLDDSPYGGGKGMILRVDALCNALNSVRDKKSHVVLLSPKGSVFNQKKARELALKEDLVFICGHYEGYDARIESYVDECISIGDFILSGGEQAAAVICDSIIRLLPNVLKDGVTEEESFESGLLEYKQYTHPNEYDGKCVPSVLLSGNQASIEKYKKVSSIMETAKYRLELLYKCGKSELIGRSKASILMFDEFVMKIDKDLDREVEALKWMQDKVNVPGVCDYDSPYLLMDRVFGKMLCDQYYLNNPEIMINVAASALKRLWSIDITNCPLDSSPDAKLMIAKNNIENGLVKFDGAEQLYEWLVNHKPTTDMVFSHGDFCLPNIIVSKKGKINYIDVGLAGVSDRYCDIALCIRSIKYNLEIAHSDYCFDEQKFLKLLNVEPDFDKIKWYTLLDELF